MVVQNPKLLDTAMEVVDYSNWMNFTHDFILDSLNEEPIGETLNFVWYITDIGIAALLKGNVILTAYSSSLEKEAKEISLDISKEEKEFFKIEDKKIFIFYSWF